MKKILCILFTLLIAFPLFCCGRETNNPPDPTDTEQPTSPPASDETIETAEDLNNIINEIDDDSDILEVMIFDAGKADAILITTENHAVIIDTGENEHGQIITDYLLSRNIHSIDYLIITHFHKDHVGGAETVIKNFAVKEVIVPNYGKNSKRYNKFIEAMQEAGLESIILTETMEFNLDSAKFTVYPSGQEYYDYSDTGDNDDYEDDENDDDISVNENNFSVVVSIDHGENNFLFTGDAKAKRLKELLLTDDIINTKYDFLKFPHHGRYNKRVVDFIYAVNPEYAVITCSIDSPADDRVVDALKEIRAKIYFTSNGNAYCKSDGNDLILSYE